MSKSAEEIADILLKIKAVTINAKQPYRYTSGLLSPVYSDLRLLMSHPKHRREVIKAWTELIHEQGEFDLIAATATAGIPHGAWISEVMNLPMVYVRSEAKGHGKKNQIEGLVDPKQKVVIVEDLVSTAKSSIATQQAIAGTGAKAKHIVAIYDYNLPQSAENLKKAKIKLSSLTSFPVLVDRATKSGQIKASERELVLDWLKDPAGWGKRYGFE